MFSPSASVHARFTGRTVLITGGGVGIGKAFAIRAATEGANVVITDLTNEMANEALEELEGSGNHLALRVDVTDTQSVTDTFREVARTFGHLDVLVNVAGGDTPHPSFELTDDETWLRMFDLNLMSVVRTCRAAIPQLRQSTRSPAIVNVSSVNAMLALGGEPYSSAKAGLSALTINLAATYGPEGIRVNSVTPGTIRTRVWDRQPSGADRMISLYPLGRVGEPADVASAIAFLASDDAAWITGYTLPVDGGLPIGPRSVASTSSPTESARRVTAVDDMLRTGDEARFV